ncbi:MAG: DUF1416 domain-containing protein [Actinomycetota bacterium]
MGIEKSEIFAFFRDIGLGGSGRGRRIQVAAIDGIVFEGIEVSPYASVRLLTPSGHVVAEQTATSAGEFRFVVPSGLWGVEAGSGEHTVAIRDLAAVDGERLPVYMRLDTGERFVHKQRSVIDLTDEASASTKLPV